MLAWELATSGNDVDSEALIRELQVALRRWRALGKRLIDLEEATDIPDSTLSRIFNGHVQNPAPSQLARIALRELSLYSFENGNKALEVAHRITPAPLADTCS